MANKSIEAGVLRDFVNAVREASSGKAPRNEYLSGVVTHTDVDGTVWVDVAGGVNDMPVTRSTASYSPGDVVSFSIENGVASIGGNASDPGAPISRVIYVLRKVDDAREEAELAMSAAESAVLDAVRAHDAADSAQASATAAQGSADDAADAAKTAQEEAVAANAAAYSALASLSDVENVAGVLNWIAEHGTWERTHDTTVQADKVYYSLSFSTVSESNPHYMGRYYELSGGVYSLTDDVSPAQGTTYYEVSDHVAVVPVSTWVGNGEWYVLDDGEYIVTTDTTVQQGTTYYARSEVYTLTSDATVDPDKDYYELVEGSYVLVIEPVDEDLGGYYELSYSYTAGMPTNDIGDYYCLNSNGSIENYIASHLALMDDGLHILADGSSYRLIVTSEGVVIRDEATNRTVASYGTETVIGDVGGVHVHIAEDKLEFLGADGVAAYVGMAYNYSLTTDTTIIPGRTYYEFVDDAYVEVENPVVADIGSYYERHEAGTSLIIDRGIIAESLTIGNWRWDKLDDGGLMLSWIGA